MFCEVFTRKINKGCNNTEYIEFLSIIVYPENKNQKISASFILDSAVLLSLNNKVDLSFLNEND